MTSHTFQVIHLCNRSNDFLSKLPQKLLVKIASYLSLEVRSRGANLVFSLAAYCSVLTEMGINGSFVHGSC